MFDSTSGRARPLLSVKGLTVGFGRDAPIFGLRDICFDLAKGEILGIVGESGSGKSLACRAITGLLPQSAQVQGRLVFDKTEIALSDPVRLARLRGRDISMMFQDPMSALDPLMTVERHLRLRTNEDPRIILEQVGLDAPERFLGAYAHQLSGGQCQRVAIACAMARKPRLLIADEPTTALDVTVQAGILRRLKNLARETGMALIFVTHDLAVVYQLCDRVLVMNNGRIVESGPTEAILTAPRDAYTKSLLDAIPRPPRQPRRSSVRGRSMGAPVTQADSAVPVLRFDTIRVRYRRSDGTRIDAVKDVSLDIRQGEIVGLVGESGSGKSTLAKTAVGLASPVSGQILLKDEPLDWRAARMQWRRDVQYIFQDPRGALDPAARILNQVCLPLHVHRIGTRSKRIETACDLMRETGLDEVLFRRKPGNLSGGQRQRATIARALTLSPKVLICDESVSALDASVQARVLDLLMGLRDKLALSILFISHDMSVVRYLCDRVAVMRHGELVENGPTADVFGSPQHDYTRKLMAAIPPLPKKRSAQPQLITVGALR